MYNKEQLKDLFRKLEEILDAAPESIADQLEQLMKGDEKPTADWWESYELGENDEKLINQFGNPENYKNCDDHEINTWKALVIRLLLNILRRVNINADEIQQRQEANRRELADHIEQAKKDIISELEKRSIVQPVIVTYPEPEKKDVSPLDPYPQPWTTPNVPYTPSPSVPWPCTPWYQQPYVTCKVGRPCDSPYGATGC